MTPEEQAKVALIEAKEQFLLLFNRMGLGVEVTDYMDDEHDDASWEAGDGRLVVTACRQEDGRYNLLLGKQVVIPGVHTMPNGDPGYPDDIDLVDIKAFEIDQINECVILAYKVWMKMWTDEVIEVYAEECMFRNIQKAEDELDECDTWKANQEQEIDYIIREEVRKEQMFRGIQ